jgi:geranylgeranyl reductase family protein
MYYDVIVIGGGPAGLIAAKKVASAGFKVCVIEEHQEIGYPSKCSGLFSVSGLKSLKLDLDPSLISTTIKGGRFYSPEGREIVAYSDVERARVVERKLFDKFLAREAARAGAEIKLRTRADKVNIGSNVSVHIKGVEGRAELQSAILVGADGVGSNVARWVGMKTPSKVVAAAQVEVEEAEVEPDIAEVYFGREYAPNFYGWILPKGEVYEVGVGVRAPEGKTPMQYLKKFIAEHPIAKRKITGKSFLEVNIGAIPVGYPVETARERVLLVGDAAGQTKASTGGGVITGGIAAQIAGSACIKALEEEDFSADFLRREYEDKWQKELGLELRVHAALRELFDSLSDDDLEYLFQLAIDEKVSELMVKYRDTDRPSEFVRELLKKERMVDALQKFLDVKSLV